MQELRFVLIIVGVLAIAALVFHGLWTSKKEGKSKFSDKPLGKIEAEPEEDLATSRSFSSEEATSKERKEPDFGSLDVESSSDPLISEPDPVDPESPTVDDVDLDDVPSMVVQKDLDDIEVAEATVESKPEKIADENEASAEPGEMEVIVLNVHCPGDTPFIGTKLFDSMQQNGLLYGEMDIFHRHADLSGTGKVLFSVANMMQPGTLKHGDPAEFSTKGISFFMTLPGFGDPAQNFKLMLKTAQQIADDLGGHVLDDARNMMTPGRLDAYRKQIQDFKVRNSHK